MRLLASWFQWFPWSTALWVYSESAGSPCTTHCELHLLGWEKDTLGCLNKSGWPITNPPQLHLEGLIVVRALVSKSARTPCSPSGCGTNTPSPFPLPANPAEGVSVCVLAPQSCLTLCNPMDCSPPASPVHRILQARRLEWVAISFSGGSSQPRDQTQVLHIMGRFFTFWTTKEAQRGRNNQNQSMYWALPGTLKRAHADSPAWPGDTFPILQG